MRVFIVGYSGWVVTRWRQKTLLLPCFLRNSQTWSLLEILFIFGIWKQKVADLRVCKDVYNKFDTYLNGHMTKKNKMRNTKKTVQIDFHMKMAVL